MYTFRDLSTEASTNVACMFFSVVEVQAFGQVHMHYCFGGSFHPLPGRTHGISTCFCCGGRGIGFHGSFHGSFRGYKFASSAAFTEAFVAVIFFHETVRRSFLCVHESFRESFRGSNVTSVKASVEVACVEASTTSMKASMETMEASVEVVEASMEAFTSSHQKCG